jgi:hypothetical protein
MATLSLDDCCKRVWDKLRDLPKHTIVNNVSGWTVLSYSTGDGENERYFFRYLQERTDTPIFFLSIDPYRAKAPMNVSNVLLHYHNPHRTGFVASEFELKRGKKYKKTSIANFEREVLESVKQVDLVIGFSIQFGCKLPIFNRNITKVIRYVSLSDDYDFEGFKPLFLVNDRVLYRPSEPMSPVEKQKLREFKETHSKRTVWVLNDSLVYDGALSNYFTQRQIYKYLSGLAKQVTPCCFFQNVGDSIFESGVYSRDAGKTKEIADVKSFLKYMDGC